jgi:hypothetical protein
MSTRPAKREWHFRVPGAAQIRGLRTDAIACQQQSSRERAGLLRSMQSDSGGAGGMTLASGRGLLARDSRLGNGGAGATAIVVLIRRCPIGRPAMSEAELRPATPHALPALKHENLGPPLMLSRKSGRRASCSRLSSQ